MNAAAFLSIFLTFFETFTSNWLDKLKAPTEDNLSSQRQRGTSIFLSILLAEIKIGHINAEAILLELDEVRQVQIKLDKEQKSIESEYTNLAFQLDSLYKSYEQTQMLMSEERRNKEQDKIRNKQAELERFQMEQVGPQGKIYQIQEQLMAPIYAKLDKAVSNVGASEGYDYIFNVSSGQIVYALPNYDVTQKVVDELNKMSESENE